jgi:uncharacterized surface protein with fasciclin (FAS1) repeats
MLDEAKEDPDLAIVVQLFEISGLAPLFSCPGPFTALFPVNGTLAALSPMFLTVVVDAFISLGEEQVREWLESADLAVLRRLLLYHVLIGKTASTEFAPGEVDTLAADEYVLVGVDPLQFDNAGVVSVDNEVCNGLLNKIDTVLDPDFIGELIVDLCISLLNNNTILPSATNMPSLAPTLTASSTPSAGPSVAPALALSETPSVAVSLAPSVAPSVAASLAPSVTLSVSPSVAASLAPSLAPTVAASLAPSVAPTLAPTTTEPTSAPTLAPTIGPTTSFIDVVINRFSLSFKLTDNTVPTAKQYEDVIVATEAFYDKKFTTKYGSFVGSGGTQFSLDFTREGDAVPPSDSRPKTPGQFNVYMEFANAKLLFKRSSTPPPSVQEVYNQLTQITTEYLLEYVKPLAGTPFASVREAFLEYTID